jgi:hypothetical protein
MTKAGTKRKKISPGKAARIRRRARLRGPLDGWAFPLALITSLLIAGPQLLGVFVGGGELDPALGTWGASLLFSWVCWAVIAAAMRTSHPLPGEGVVEADEPAGGGPVEA